MRQEALRPYIGHNINFLLAGINQAGAGKLISVGEECLFEDENTRGIIETEMIIAVTEKLCQTISKD